MKTWIFLLMGGLGGCTSGSFDLSGPLGDECEGPACAQQLDRSVVDRGLVRDEGPPPDLGRDGQLADSGPLDGAVDQAVDASSACEPGSMEVCGDDKGLCTPGSRSCLPNGTWSDCLGGTPPAPEACDGLDNDCDGNLDEGVSLPCGPEAGACQPGLQVCVDGVLSACEGAIGPAPEACNDQDDDCDGTTDEEVLEGCDPAPGVCAFGTRVCMAGIFDACVQPGGPIDELCDGVDNDCDGLADEGLVRLCGESVGACLPGQSVCLGGTWSLCEGAQIPADEQCNALDDDCDGVVDEGVTRACAGGNNACDQGIETCVLGEWGACEGLPGGLVEVCDGLDNDCDGPVDEGLDALPCGGSVGVCEPGIQRCVGGVLGVCEGGVEPTEEDCNGVDDNCNGSADELLERVCGQNQGICVAGVQRCNRAAWGACVGEVPAQIEVCNGLDDDCDGVVDVALGGVPAPCIFPRSTGACQAGACAIAQCDAGWHDINGVVDDGCERGVSLLGNLSAYDPLLANTPVRVRVAPGAPAAAYLSGEDADTARLTLVIDEAARVVGDGSIVYRDLDVAAAEPGFVVVGLGTERILGRDTVTWTRRGPDGSLVFSGSQTVPGATQITVAVAARARRMLITWVDASGALGYLVLRLDAGGAPLVGPFQVADEVQPGVRPAALGLGDGFVIFAPRSLNRAAQLGAWFFDHDGGLIRAAFSQLPDLPTELTATEGPDLGRVALRVDGSVTVVDFPPSAVAARLGDSRAVARALNGRNPGLLAGPGGWLLTWLDEGTLQPMAGVLDDQGLLTGDPARLLPALRDPVDSLQVHSAPGVVPARVGVGSGIRGRAGVLEFN